MNLNNLRKRLNELDRQLVELIAERQSVVEQVGELKRAEGQATRDYAREKQVLDGARANAAELDIAPDIVEEVMRLLIRTSLTRQERARVRAEGQGDGLKALVIGGGGKMGRWFGNFLDSQGYDITVADPENTVAEFSNVADWREAGSDFAVTVVAAPLQPTAQIMEEMAVRGQGGLVFAIIHDQSHPSSSPALSIDERAQPTSGVLSGQVGRAIPVHILLPRVVYG